MSSAWLALPPPGRELPFWNLDGREISAAQKLQMLPSLVAGCLLAETQPFATFQGSLYSHCKISQSLFSSSHVPVVPMWSLVHISLVQPRDHLHHHHQPWDHLFTTLPGFSDDLDTCQSGAPGAHTFLGERSPPPLNLDLTPQPAAGRKCWGIDLLMV